MPTPTYIPLGTATLTSPAASVSFSSIAQTYRDLILVTNVNSTAGAGHDFVINGDTGSNYSIVFMSGSAGTNTNAATEPSFYLGSIQSTFSPTMSTIQIMDYSTTDKHKTQLTRFGQMIADGTAGNRQVWALAGRWANTAAVTSITVRCSGSTFSSGSTFALYGIAA